MKYRRDNESPCWWLKNPLYKPQFSFPSLRPHADDPGESGNAPDPSPHRRSTLPIRLLPAMAAPSLTRSGRG